MAIISIRWPLAPIAPADMATPAATPFPGCSILSLNASLNRYFRLAAMRAPLQLRLSATNALNNSLVIRSIGTTVNSATYGLPTAASDTRVVTAYLRFNL